MPLRLPPSRETRFPQECCLRGRVRNPGGKVSADQLCNLRDKMSGSQKRIQSYPEHLWGKQWQDPHTTSVLLTPVSFASLCASLRCPLDIDRGVQLKFTCCLYQRSRQTKYTTSKQSQEETIGCQLLINKFSLDCF